MAFLGLRWVEFFWVCNGGDGGGFLVVAAEIGNSFFLAEFFWLKAFILF